MKSNEVKSIYFGEYPQTIKDDSVEISNIQDARGYYLGSDGCYYAKVIAKPYYCLWVDKDTRILDRKYNMNEEKAFIDAVGEKFYLPNLEFSEDVRFKMLPINTMHKYKFSNGEQIIPHREYYFRVEQILWDILCVENDTALLVSHSILDAMPYSITCMDKATVVSSSSVFKKSIIRMWLNGYSYDGAYNNGIAQLRLRNSLNTSFIDCAFNVKDLEALLSTKVNNSYATTNNGGAHHCTGETEDKVFLLSYADTINEKYGFSKESKHTDTQRIKDTTDFSRAIGVQINGELYGTCAEWWLRSPVESQTASLVNYNGSSNLGFVTNKSYGVAPAIKINTILQQKIEEENLAEIEKDLELRKKEAKKAISAQKKRAKEKVEENKMTKEELESFISRVEPKQEPVGKRMYTDPDALVGWHDYTEGYKISSYSGLHDEENNYYDKQDMWDETHDKL
ncbi:MAG: hypothetical protein IJ033_06180 [Clostridia bacterium]|nr:hypothetical protein [Clostridia bacterium]